MIDIRPIKTIKGARYVEKIITAAWGSDEIVIPDHLTITLAKENGGVVLLAWDEDKPVGFCLGFLSFTGDENRVSKHIKLKHCSHMAGVLPEYRGQKLGERLKWAQREAVLAMGIELITWTYDPLESLNGRLNLHKLGAVCNTYTRNIYGDGRDALNWGVPTDRFRVDWHIASPWVQSHHDHTHPFRTFDEWTAVGIPIANPPTIANGIWRAGSIDAAAFAQKQVLAAIPHNYQAVKKASVEWGLDWRLHMRELFERAFSAGFTAVDLLVKDDLSYYLLEKHFDEN
jgi:predicted GNAT superfamily acetyltransferase